MFKIIPNLIWETSERQLGDCRINPDKFLETLGLTKDNLVLAQQIHGNRIRIVGTKEKGLTISGTDGLITQIPGVILGIHTADCLPVLFYEPVAKVIGACHAGWKGALTKLPQKMVDRLILTGAHPENIIVAIGPHICRKCYEVKPDMVQKFVKEFGQLSGMLVKKNDKIYLDLAVPVIFQLTNSGIQKQNILMSEDCTSCNNDQYFSYRKDTKDSYGEMLSVISLIK